jgi:hypothetical protein
MKIIWVPLEEEDIHRALRDDSFQEEVKVCKPVEVYRDEDPEEIIKSLVENFTLYWILVHPDNKRTDQIFEGCYKCTYCGSEFQTRKEYKNPELHDFPCAWASAHEYLKTQKESRNES